MSFLRISLQIPLQFLEGFCFAPYRCGMFCIEKSVLEVQSKGIKIVTAQIRLLNLSLVSNHGERETEQIQA